MLSLCICYSNGESQQLCPWCKMICIHDVSLLSTILCWQGWFLLNIVEHHSYWTERLIMLLLLHYQLSELPSLYQDRIQRCPASAQPVSHHSDSRQHSTRHCRGQRRPASCYSRQRHGLAAGSSGASTSATASPRRPYPARRRGRSAHTAHDAAPAVPEPEPSRRPPGKQRLPALHHCCRRPQLSCLCLHSNHCLHLNSCRLPVAGVCDDHDWRCFVWCHLSSSAKSTSILEHKVRRGDFQEVFDRR